MAYIELHNISYSIKNNIKVFDGLNFDIEQEEFISLIGENGSGKTTLSKMMIGIIKPDKGYIGLNNQKIEKFKLYEIGQQVGYLFQNPDLQLFHSTIKDELLFASRFSKTKDMDAQKRFEELIVELSLEDCLLTHSQNLSQGEKQRLAIGTILMNKPKFLILDEPTTGLDYKRKAELLELLIHIHQKGVGVLLISHDVGFIGQLPGRVAKLHHGRIDYV